MTEILGTVIGVYAPTLDSLVSQPLEYATVKVGGFEEDKRHFGLMRKSGGREKQYEKGTPILNYRQISIVSAEELEVIANELNVAEIKPEWLGANMIVSGIPHLTQLPSTSRLYFPNNVTLIVFGENYPCKYPGEVIQEQYQNIPKLDSNFVKAAMHRRGLVSLVEREGIIRVGDEVKVEIPY
ncbi:MOSC domain-containing protein [Candidatus Woesearchaeota archaeon]|nr:MOSC domain-containing protein [Candidatus Woesearchaeota archaeon]